MASSIDNLPQVNEPSLIGAEAIIGTRGRAMIDKTALREKALNVGRHLEFLRNTQLSHGYGYREREVKTRGLKAKTVVQFIAFNTPVRSQGD